MATNSNIYVSEINFWKNLDFPEKSEKKWKIRKILFSDKSILAHLRGSQMVKNACDAILGQMLPKNNNVVFVAIFTMISASKPFFGKKKTENP